MTRCDLNRRLSDLELERGMSDGGRDSTTIQNVAINEDDEITGVFETVRSEQDENGEWHSETERHDYADLNDVDTGSREQ